jgi:glycosyltransferase involved in cell wall biosynthesis
MADAGPAPALTVFIPVFNGEAFLDAAVRSVLTQEGPSFELLVVDDGSTDLTPSILAGFAATDSRIRVITNTSNQGASYSANLAIREARGRFLLRLDADDISLPGRHIRQYAVLLRGDVQVVGGEIELIGEKQGRVPFPHSDGDIKANFFACANNIANPASAFDLHFVRQAGLTFNQQLRVAEDLNFWIACMLARAKFENVAEPVIQYRIHPGQASRSAELMRKAQADIRERLLTLWFPTLHALDRRVIQALLLGGALPREALLMGLGALQVMVKSKTQSYSGESIPRLTAYLGMVANASLTALQASPPVPPRPIG